MEAYIEGCMVPLALLLQFSELSVLECKGNPHILLHRLVCRSPDQHTSGLRSGQQVLMLCMLDHAHHTTGGSRLQALAFYSNLPDHARPSLQGADIAIVLIH